jgi:hypothetical protein
MDPDICDITFGVSLHSGALSCVLPRIAEHDLDVCCQVQRRILAGWIGASFGQGAERLDDQRWFTGGAAASPRRPATAVARVAG